MKLIIDCDPGNGIPGANVDDAIALVFALRHPRVDVRSIWTVFGNTSAAEGYTAARNLLAELGEHTPIFRGSEQPLSGNRNTWRQRLDAPSQDPAVYSLWGSTAAPRRYSTTTSIDPLPAMARNLRLAGDGVILACLGPLTNIAKLVKEAPDALTGVERIYLMGGTLGHGELVDTNFAVDPLAASVVLHAGLPLTIIPLDVTRTTQLSRVAWQAVLNRTPVEQGNPMRLVSKWLEPWLEYSSRTRPVDGMWLHDLVVIVALAEPTLVKRQAAHLDVTDSPAGKLVRTAAGVVVDLVTSVDNAALISLWADTVTGQK